MLVMSVAPDRAGAAEMALDMVSVDRMLHFSPIPNAADSRFASRAAGSTTHGTRGGGTASPWSFADLVFTRGRPASTARMIEDGTLETASVGLDGIGGAAPMFDMLTLRRQLFFSSVDITKDNRYVGIGVRSVPFLAESPSSFITSMTIGSGWYRYKRRRLARRWIEANTAAMTMALGYRFDRSRHGVAVLIGPALEFQRLSYTDPDNRAEGLRLAARAVIDAWAKPLPRVLLTGYGAASTFDGAWYGRAFAGYELFDAFFIGPESIAHGNRFYLERRLGVAYLGLPSGQMRTNLSVGVRLLQNRTSDYYVTGTIWRRF